MKTKCSNNKAEKCLYRSFLAGVHKQCQVFEREMEKDRNAARQEANEKKLAYAEIKQLQGLIGEMETTI